MSRMLKTYGEGEVVTSLREARQVNIDQNGEGSYSMMLDGEVYAFRVDGETVEGREETLEVIGDILDDKVDYNQVVTEELDQDLESTNTGREVENEYEELLDDQDEVTKLEYPAGKMR